jgi:drug/metabolite transporter (DMT)-like permease
MSAPPSLLSRISRIKQARSARAGAVAQALFVTFLWSTSWVLIKVGLRDIPPLTFAGLRYVLAFLCLLSFVLASPAERTALRTLSRKRYVHLALYGLLFVAFTQGAQFAALGLLPAVTVSLLLNFTPVVVALLGIALLHETPTGRQWLGVGVYLSGVGVYFYPAALPAEQVAGVVVALLCVLGAASSTVVGRGINRGTHLSPLLVTTVSMGVGSVALLAAGIAIQGFPAISIEGWLIVGWLAVVNTAVAFPIWNRTLRTLPAVESSIINSTMLVQIALLAWLFLGETLSPQDLAGLALVAVGVLVVQLGRGERNTKAQRP